MIDSSRPDYGDTPVSATRPPVPYVGCQDDPPVVTIVTPFFNTGSVFDDTARSVLAQSLQTWEWLIVNDGSQERSSLTTLDAYRGRDHRIRIIDLPRNGGLAAARNAGAAAARAPYLLFLDSDDLLEPTAAEKWYWFLESYEEFGFVKGFSVGFGAMEYLATSGFHDEAAFLERNRTDVTSLVRADVFNRAGGFPADNRDGLEDWEFWLRCAASGLWGGTVPEFLSWYRRRDDDAQRWQNWQGDGGGPALRARLRTAFAHLYAEPSRFPSPRPPQIRTAGRGAVTGANRLQKQASRLLLLVPWLTTGGADRFSLDLVAQLQDRGWEVTVVATRQGDMSWLPAFTRLTPDVFVLPNMLRLSDYPRFLRYLMHSRQVDAVLVANSEIGYRLLPILRAESPAVAFLDFCHMEEEEWNGGGYPRLSIDAAAFLDRTIVLSEHLRQWMIARGRAAESLTVSHNGVSIPDREEIARQRASTRAVWSAGDVPVVLFAGRIVAQKQPDLFVDVLARIAAEGIPFIGVIAGDGPGLPAMRERLRQTGIESRVRVLGALTPAEMEGVLCGADVLCLPSKWEGIALVIQEAMARGVAVVAADVGGQRELVTSDCGVLIPPGARDTMVAAYAVAVRRLLVDHDGRRSMGARGQARVATGFRLDQMGRRMDDLLRSSLSRTHGTGALSDAGDAVEALRSQYVPYWQWVQAQATGLPVPTGWNARLFRSMTVLEPVYRWGLRRGWTWLPALRRGLRGRVRRLLGLDAR